MIESTGNPQIRNVVALKKKAKERTSQGVFLVEGPKMFREAPEERLVKVYVSESFSRKYKGSDLMNRAEKSGKCEVVTDKTFAYMSDTQTPQGVICLVRQFHYTPSQLLGKMGVWAADSGRTGKEAERSKDIGQAPLCMVLENLQDPGNLGTILRTSEGAGVTGILLSEGCVDIYNPKVIRSTMGSIYRMPFAYTSDLKRTMAEWKQAGVHVFAAHLKGKNAYDLEDYTGPAAFLIGNESRGLTDETASLADTYIRIPMCGRVESLNAAVASSLLMYEAFRQRRSSR